MPFFMHNPLFDFDLWALFPKWVLKLNLNEWNDIMIKERQKIEFMDSFVYKNNNEKGLESIEIAFADIF